jgi:phosphatidylethanolamine/phosphatidyl-N-methylethanolamine N-methyltransferase
MGMTNRWNRAISRFWSPVYDLIFDCLVFAPNRRRVFELLQLKGDERILMVGVGTGADLAYLPPGVSVTGVDLSPEMLKKAQQKIRGINQRLLVQGDAQLIPVQAGCFDVVILSLILSVVPHAQACWCESLRALRPGGIAVIFDKFLPDDQNPTLFRRILNLGAKLLGTDINRRLADILAGTDYQININEAALFKGMYRIILIQTSSGKNNV